MASCKIQHWKQRLTAVKEILGSLLHSQKKVEDTLEELVKILHECITHGENAVRNTCFSLGVAKALLGILRSSSESSMLSKAASCVALLVHDNEDGRIMFGGMGVIPALLDLLIPYPVKRGVRDVSPLPWPKEWIPVYEQVVICLRKLTFYNADNQQELARLGAIKLLICIIMDRGLMKNFNQFSPEAKHNLEALVLQKKFISKVCCVPEEERKTVLGAFSALECIPDLTLHYPAFYMDLMSKDGGHIASSMCKKGLAWPNSDGVPEPSKWTCVVVRSVEGGNNVWCQFCTQAPSQSIVLMNKTLEELGAPLTEMPAVPIVGDVYIAYCDAPTVSASRKQWFRIRVLNLSGNQESARVLAVDFGFTLTVPCNCLQPLPTQCRGIPPQAVPCKLNAISPMPASINLLENCTAVIRNMAFEASAFRKEIKIFKGIEAMIQLAECPDRGTVLQALGALLNLTVDEEFKEDVGNKGALKMALDHIEYSSSDGDVLESSIGLLMNCSINCKNNVDLIMELRGEAIVHRVQLEESIPENQRERISILMQGLLQLLLPIKKKEKGDSPNKRCSEGGSTSALKSPIKLESALSKDFLYYARRRANGERAHSKPIIQCQESETDSEISESEWENPNSQHDSSNHHRGDSYGPPALLLNTNISPHVKGKRSIFYPWPAAQFQMTSLKKSICAVMNAGKEGVVYLGVDEGGIIKGCKITRSQRDLLCVRLDNLMNGSFTPPIQSDQYAVSFLPIAVPKPKGGGGVCNGVSNEVIIADYFVIKLTLNKSECYPVYTVRERNGGFEYERCYYRTEVGLNERLSSQDLRDLIANREVHHYKDELEQIQKSIKDLQSIIDTL